MSNHLYIINRVGKSPIHNEVPYILVFNKNIYSTSHILLPYNFIFAQCLIDNNNLVVNASKRHCFFCDGIHKKCESI